MNTRRRALIDLDARHYPDGGSSMPSVEERLAYLEGQVSEHAHAFGDLRESIRQLEHWMDLRFDVMERRVEAIDRRFEAVWLVGIQASTLVAVVGAFVTVVAALIARP